MTESVFGDLDMDNVRDDPWLVDANVTYRTIVTESNTTDKVDDDGNTVRTWKWTYHVDDESSDFHGMPIRERHSYFLGERGKWENLNAKEKLQLSLLYDRLRKAFDYTKSDLPTVKTEDLIGKVVYVTTVNNESKREGDDRKFTNVRTALSERLFQEQGGALSEASTATGSSLGI
jgi:hypothetical protein